MRLNREIEKICPPSDKRINALLWLGSIFATASIVIYFLVSTIFFDIIIDDARIWMGYLTIILDISIISVGLFFSIFQLIRNKYPRVINSVMLYLICSAMIAVYLIYVSLHYGSIPSLP